MPNKSFTVEQLMLENTALRKRIQLLECKLEAGAKELSAANNKAVVKSMPGLNQTILNIPDTMFRAAKDGTILEFSSKPADQQSLGEEMVGQNIRNIVPPHIADFLLNFINQSMSAKKTEVLEYEITDNSTVYYREMRLVSCEKDEILAIIQDITDRKIIEEELYHLSHHDPLTNLFNRAYFHKIIQKFSVEHKASIGVIACDIDGLKLVNDTFGHHEGDKLLTAAANIISNALESTDIAARIGGDEFVIILPNCTEDILEATCQKIEDGVAAYNATKPQSALSVSMGMALDCSGSPNLIELFKTADDRMYLEKLHRSRSTRSALVQTLKQALEERDFITEGHGERMQDLVQTLAKAVGIPEHHLPTLRLFAQFHDIGKVGIPDQVLFKPGPLTPEEREIMRSHSTIGYRIAQSSTDLASIADWILKHHEWWNGQGYPLGLSGEDIPLECRILALADAYDAMTSDRPYRKAMPHEKAIIKLKKEARGQFDPDLIDVFVELFA
jgi:diguanylate cyclase (GGDEF)-like protein/PAS domain S-box-containing protein